MTRAPQPPTALFPGRFGAAAGIQARRENPRASLQYVPHNKSGEDDGEDRDISALPPRRACAKCFPGSTPCAPPNTLRRQAFLDTADRGGDRSSEQLSHLSKSHSKWVAGLGSRGGPPLVCHEVPGKQLALRVTPTPLQEKFNFP